MTSQKVDNTILAAIIGSLGAIIASILLLLFSYPALFNVIYIALIALILLAIQTYIIVRFSPIYEHYKNWNDARNQNKLARKIFEGFKEKNFVGKYKRIQSVRDDPEYIYDTFHRVVNTLRGKGFDEIQDPEIKLELIREHFNFWLERYNFWCERYRKLIGGMGIKDFIALFSEFDRIVKNYHDSCIWEPKRQIEEIIKAGEQIPKIPEYIDKDWRSAMEYYIDFWREYKDFVDRVNEEFGSELLEGEPLEGIPLIEEL